jgi:CubicO group peptidase (beta-lactamase class C family)
MRRGCRSLLLMLLLVAPAHASVAAMPDSVVTAGLERYMAAAAAEGFRGAVLVARGENVLLARGYGTTVPGGDHPITAETVFTTGSITKQFTATAILKLETQGKLSLQDKLGRWFDAVPADKSGITLHQLLTHTAGFPGAIGDDRERIGRDAYVQRALATPLLFAPGARYEYSNVGYSLLAAIVEKASGQGYEPFLHDQLFVPAGMHDTGYRLPAWDPARLAHGSNDDGSDWGTTMEHAILPEGPGWNLLGNGGIHSTVLDMLRWHRALAGDAILPAAARAQMITKQVEEGGGTWYGYGWSIEPTDWGTLITHNGGNPYYFADFLRFLDSDVVIYYTTASRERRMRRLARPLARIVFTGEVPALPPSVPAAGTAPAASQSGTAAAPGSLASKWGLPGGPQAQRAAELLEALTTSDAAWRRDFVRTGFVPDVLESQGEDALDQSLVALRDELAEFRVQRVVPTADGLTLVLETPGAPTELEISVEPEPPHRIISIGVQKGG